MICKFPPAEFFELIKRTRLVWRGVKMTMSRFPLKMVSLVALSSAAPLVGVASENVRPNIILILADDLGWKDAGFRGSRYYETPNLDRLAGESVEFTRAYASPSCAPSRAALLTGQYSPRTGVFMVGRSDRGDKTLQKLVPVPNRQALPPEAITIAKVLAEHGYATTIIGKWHLGDGPNSPENRGFGLNVAGFDGGTPPTYFSPYQIATIKDGPPGEYLTDRLTDEAINFMENNRERPFFLYLPHYAVHVPIEAKENLKQAFSEKTPDGEQKDPGYAAMIQSLDESVGRILDAVDRLGLADRTHIIFISDNGGQMGITAQPPLREGKGWLYEGGVRVPMLVRTPGTSAAGTKSDTPVHLVDIFPTILQWAGIETPKGPPLDGVSLAPLSSDKTATIPTRDLFWHFPGYQPKKTGFRITPSSMLVNDQWKLIEHFEDGSLELYNLQDDISEQHNLAAAQPDKAAELKTRLTSWREKVSAPMPTKITP